MLSDKIIDQIINRGSMYQENYNIVLPQLMPMYITIKLYALQMIQCLKNCKFLFHHNPVTC